MSSLDKWYVVTQSTGERYEECVNYSEARSYADGMHMWFNRTEHYQVFVDDGKGPPTMMYDVVAGDEPPAGCNTDPITNANVVRSVSSKRCCLTAPDPGPWTAGVDDSADPPMVQRMHSIRDSTRAAEDAASASDLKASTLAPQDHERDDPSIAAAMAAAAGKPSSVSSSDRLAALRAG